MLFRLLAAFLGYAAFAATTAFGIAEAEVIDEYLEYKAKRNRSLKNLKVWAVLQILHLQEEPLTNRKFHIALQLSMDQY